MRYARRRRDAEDVQKGMAREVPAHIRCIIEAKYIKSLEPKQNSKPSSSLWLVCMEIEGLGE